LEFLEHEGFVGSRGGGVVIEPSKLQKTCTQPNEQGCNAQPNQGIKAPKLTANKGSVNIEVNGLPNQRYQVEFFGNQSTTSKEAEQYLGTITVATDVQGNAKANWKPTVKVASITANVTDHFGATSELGFVQVK